MSRTTIISFFFTGSILLSAAIDPPTDCQFLNPIHDSSAEIALLDFFNNSEPFVFKENNFFQPQCLLCEKFSGQVCFGYKSGASYGITSGTINVTRLVTNLPYIYSLGENVGALYTTVYAIAALREDLVISYRTLSRFKGIATLDPFLVDKSIVLRLCLICLSGDTNEHLLTLTGSVYKLTIRLFVNEIAVNANNGILLDGNVQARINCRDRTVTVQSISNIPNDSPCSNTSCLGPEFCLTYQPEYATTRETWCPLTENNWISIPDNSLKLSPPDSSLPLHIQIERILLYQNSFTLILNPNWFINYTGVLTLSIPEATPGYYSDPVWKIVLPSTAQRPLNQRTFLLYNCADIRIQYNASDSEYFQTTIIFVDMKSNSTFTIRDNLDEAKRLCNPEILVAIGDNSSTTNPSRKPVDSTTPWKSAGSGQLLQPFVDCCDLFFYVIFQFLILVI